MIRFAHKPCGTEVAEYVGTETMHASLEIKSKDWIVLGLKPIPLSENLFLCPCCKNHFSIGSRWLEEIADEAERKD